MNTTSTDIINSFHSTFQDKVPLPSGLENQWLLDAIGEIELDLGNLGYDEKIAEFSSKLKQYIIKTLGLQMKVYYLEREVSRILKLSNISSKDLSLNGMGDTKRVAIANLRNQISTLDSLIHKQKQTAYAN